MNQSAMNNCARTDPTVSGTQSRRRSFAVVVSNDDCLTQHVRSTAQRYCVLLRARSPGEALTMLAQTTGCAGGLVLDLDVCGLHPLHNTANLRIAHPVLPILALASRSTPELINGLQALRVELAMKPASATNLDVFLRRALVVGWLPDARIAAWIDAQVRVHGLTAREVQLMTYAIGSESRPRVMSRLGITENTLKTQVRALLRKFGARSMDALAVRALREALAFDPCDGMYEWSDASDGVESRSSHFVHGRPGAKRREEVVPAGQEELSPRPGASGGRSSASMGA